MMMAELSHEKLARFKIGYICIEHAEGADVCTIQISCRISDTVLGAALDASGIRHLILTLTAIESAILKVNEESIDGRR